MTTIQQFDYATDLNQVLLWQNESSTNIKSLVEGEQQYLFFNHTQFWEDWFTGVFWLWNNTPLGEPGSFTQFGAAVWSIILGIPLQIGPEPEPEGSFIFQFDQSGNFDLSTFSNRGQALDLIDQMLLLRLRYFQLTTNGAIPQINAFIAPLLSWYGYDGQVYVIDNLNMSISYIFTNPISINLQFILEQYDILPRPAGVELHIVITPGSLFAFDNPQNFDNGNFITGS